MMTEWAITVYQDGDNRVIKVMAQSWADAVNRVLAIMKQFRNVS